MLLVLLIILLLMFGGGWYWSPAEPGPRNMLWAVLFIFLLLYLLAACGVIGHLTWGF